MKIRASHAQRQLQVLQITWNARPSYQGYLRQGRCRNPSSSAIDENKLGDRQVDQILFPRAEPSAFVEKPSIMRARIPGDCNTCSCR